MINISQINYKALPKFPTDHAEGKQRQVEDKRNAGDNQQLECRAHLLDQRNQLESAQRLKCMREAAETADNLKIDFRKKITKRWCARLLEIDTINDRTGTHRCPSVSLSVDLPRRKLAPSHSHHHHGHPLR